MNTKLSGSTFPNNPNSLFISLDIGIVPTPFPGRYFVMEIIPFSRSTFFHFNSTSSDRLRPVRRRVSHTSLNLPEFSRRDSISVGVRDHLIFLAPLNLRIPERGSSETRLFLLRDKTCVSITLW